MFVNLRLLSIAPPTCVAHAVAGIYKCANCAPWVREADLYHRQVWDITDPVVPLFITTGVYCSQSNYSTHSVGGLSKWSIFGTPLKSGYVWPEVSDFVTPPPAPFRPVVVGGSDYSEKSTAGTSSSSTASTTSSRTRK